MQTYFLAYLKSFELEKKKEKTKHKRALKDSNIEKMKLSVAIV